MLGGSHFPNSEYTSKASVIQTVWYWNKDKGKINRIKPRAQK
jgi:hypothetical protein